MSQRVVPEWICNVGEQPMCMVAHDNMYTNTKEVVVTGDQSIFVITDKG